MSKHLLIREHGEYVPIAAKAVLRVEGNGNYVNIYLKNGKVFYNQPGSIGDWKKELEKLIFFVKICRSHIVNYHRVVSFSMKNGVLLCLCAARDYEKIIAMPAGEEKANAIKKKYTPPAAQYRRILRPQDTL